MPATPAAADPDQRAALVAKADQRLDQQVELAGQGLIQYFRLVLQDLPYAGQPSLLGDAHRLAIERLVERASRMDIRIVSVVGHTSEPGSAAYNQQLSVQRAQAAFDHLVHAVETSGLFDDNTLVAGITPQGRGETQPAEPTADGADHPLNRRVEIAYRLRLVFPQPEGGAVPRSRWWKVDFAAAGSLFVVQAGLGTLSMLPDDETGQGQTISRPLSWESLGITVGLGKALRKLGATRRMPKVSRLGRALDPKLGGNYARTEAFLNAIGFEVGLVSGGGEFFTPEPLSLHEMSRFNFASVSGNLSFGGSGEGALLMLHSPYFFASTVIYGVAMDVAVPNLSLGFVPAGWVQVDV